MNRTCTPQLFLLLSFPDYSPTSLSAATSRSIGVAFAVRNHSPLNALVSQLLSSIPSQYPFSLPAILRPCTDLLSKTMVFAL